MYRCGAHTHMRFYGVEKLFFAVGFPQLYNYYIGPSSPLRHWEKPVYGLLHNYTFAAFMTVRA
jgi:hypothetical protein